MQKLIKLADGLWHIKQFVDPETWADIKHKILNLPNSEYTQQHEPMRSRLEILNPSDAFYARLRTLSKHTVQTVSEITNTDNLRDPPGLFLWRDFRGFKSDWHPDDFTRAPTAQIYVDGDQEQGTSFKIDNKETVIPFEPNTGYLMDNRYQIVHGMISPVQNRVRQSIYLIY